MIRNTADTDIFGVALKSSVALTDGPVILASLGYIDTEYDTVRFDLNRDNVGDGKDASLKPPRVPTWTYSLGLLYRLS